MHPCHPRNIFSLSLQRSSTRTRVQSGTRQVYRKFLKRQLKVISSRYLTTKICLCKINYAPVTGWAKIRGAKVFSPGRTSDDCGVFPSSGGCGVNSMGELVTINFYSLSPFSHSLPICILKQSTWRWICSPHGAKPSFSSSIAFSAFFSLLIGLGLLVLFLLLTDQSAGTITAALLARAIVTVLFFLCFFPIHAVFLI